MTKLGEIKYCEMCGDKYLSHRRTDRFCSTEHRNDWHNRERTKAFWAMKLAEDSTRAELMKQAAPNLREWVKSVPREVMSINDRQAERVDRITREGWEEEPEVKPNFAPRSDFQAKLDAALQDKSSSNENISLDDDLEPNSVD